MPVSARLSHPDPPRATLSPLTLLEMAMSARLEFEIIENEGRFVFPAAAEQPYRSLLDSLVSESTTDNEFVWSLQAGEQEAFR